MSASDPQSRPFLLAGSGLSAATASIGHFCRMPRTHTNADAQAEFGNTTTARFDMPLVVPCSSVSDRPIGVFLTGASSAANGTKPVLVQTGGVARVATSDTTIKVRDLIATASDGTAQLCAAGQFPVGMAVGEPDLSISGFVDVLLFPEGMLFDAYGRLAGFSYGTPPTIATASPLNWNATLSGTDTRGLISIAMGSNPAAAGTLATVTFARAYTSPPVVHLTPQNAAAAATPAYPSVTAGGFSIITTGTMAANTTAQYGFMAIA